MSSGCAGSTRADQLACPRVGGSWGLRWAEDPETLPLDLLGSGAYRFSSFADYLNAVETARPEVNAACLVGHSTLRLRYMDNLDRPANARE